MVDTPGAEAPSSPDITHVDPSAKKTWMGHPRQLARLFSVEMWERFGFYGMRALLCFISSSTSCSSNIRRAGSSAAISASYISLR